MRDEGWRDELGDGGFAETRGKLVGGHTDFTGAVPHVNPVIVTSPHTVVAGIVAGS